MEPVPRARLCHDDAPGRERAASPPHWNRSPRRTASSSGETASIPAAARQAAPSSAPAAAADAASGSGPHSASTALPRLLSSLPYFHRMMSGAPPTRTSTTPNADAIASARASTPPGIPADVEDAGDRRGVGLDHTRLQVQGGTHHAHAVHVLEQPQRRGLVGHAVLHRDDGDGRRRGRRQRAQRLARCAGSSSPAARRRRRGSRCPPGATPPGSTAPPSPRRVRPGAARRRVSRRGGRRARSAPRRGRAAPTDRPPPRRSRRRRTPRIAWAAAWHTRAPELSPSGG